MRAGNVSLDTNSTIRRIETVRADRGGSPAAGNGFRYQFHDKKDWNGGFSTLTFRVDRALDTNSTIRRIETHLSYSCKVSDKRL